LPYVSLELEVAIRFQPENHRAIRFNEAAMRLAWPPQEGRTPEDQFSRGSAERNVMIFDFIRHPMFAGRMKW
jgi:hypothetical protein